MGLYASVIPYLAFTSATALLFLLHTPFLDYVIHFLLVFALTRGYRNYVGDKAKRRISKRR